MKILRFCCVGLHTASRTIPEVLPNKGVLPNKAGSLSQLEHIEAHKATFCIEDNGQGIEALHIDKIFNMFYRANKSAKGSGLGLYIVKEAVAKLSGEISVKSTLGKGTTFMVIIPNKIEHQLENFEEVGLV